MNIKILVYVGLRVVTPFKVGTMFWGTHTSTKRMPFIQTQQEIDTGNKQYLIIGINFDKIHIFRIEGHSIVR